MSEQPRERSDASRARLLLENDKGLEFLSNVVRLMKLLEKFGEGMLEQIPGEVAKNHGLNEQEANDLLATIRGSVLPTIEFIGFGAARFISVLRDERSKLVENQGGPS